MLTRPIWTSHARAAFLAGDEPCYTCGGHGRIQVTGPRDNRVCPSCRGAGVPLSIKAAFDAGFTLHEWKAARQTTRGRA